MTPDEMAPGPLTSVSLDPELSTAGSSTPGLVAPGTVVAGIDVGGTKILGRAFSVEEPTVVLAEALLPTPAGTDAVLDTMTAVGETLAKDPTVLDRGGLAAVGVGVPGLVTHQGVLRFAPNLPGITELAVGAALTDRLGLAVSVDNDGNCAMWCEAVLGSARGAANAMLVTLGTGIGGGIVLDGKLYRGTNGFAGEPGHMVVDPVGPLCPCGRRGCWERFGSGTGLGRLGREAAEAGRAASVIEAAGGDSAAITGQHITAAALDGDAEALVIFRDFAWWVALGIANLVNILDLEIVVVGGGVVAAGDVLIDPIRESFEGLVLAPAHRPPITIVAATFGPEAGSIGAGLLAREQVS